MTPAQAEWDAILAYLWFRIITKTNSWTGGLNLRFYLLCIAESFPLSSVYIDLAVLPVPAQLKVKQENALGSISLFFSLKYSCTTTLQLDGNLWTPVQTLFNFKKYGDFSKLREKLWIYLLEEEFVATSHIHIKAQTPQILNKIVYCNEVFKTKGRSGGAWKPLLAASSDDAQKTCFDYRIRLQMFLFACLALFVRIKRACSHKGLFIYKDYTC